MAELDTFNSFMMTPQGTQFSLSYHAVPYHEAIMQISWHGIYYSQISGLLLSSPLPYRESSCLMVQPNVYIAQKIIIYNTMITKKCHQSLQYIFLQKLQQVFELGCGVVYLRFCTRWSKVHSCLVSNKYPTSPQLPGSSSRHWSAFFCNCQI